ncbi:MAG: hypothetical protein LBD23_07960 [Oscillospiraceae bacterium]|jgi:hypothetical protein|nr:hypothetical protein [Oscillospiraceae bacterium]
MKIKVISTVILYIMFAIVCVMGVFFYLTSFLKIDAGWTFISGVISAMFLLIYSSIIYTMTIAGSIEKYYIEGNIIMFCFVVFATKTLLVLFISSLIGENSLFVNLMLILSSLTLICILVSPLIYKKARLSMIDTFAVIYFDYSGIHSKNIIGNDYFLPWDECIDIGWASYGYEFVVMYFSKKQLTEKELNNIGRINFSDKFISIHFIKGLTDDVLQFIEKDRIARFDSVDSKGKVRGL